MLNAEKCKRITEKLSKERRIALKIDGIKVVRRKGKIYIKGDNLNDQIFLEHNLKFLLPYCKVISQ